jgi:hypothetical protein
VIAAAAPCFLALPAQKTSEKVEVQRVESRQRQRIMTR